MVMKIVSHKWPRRGPTERRIHPRVAVGFPITLNVDSNAPAVEGLTVDLSLGGIRVQLQRYIELFSRLAISMELPITGRDGEVQLERVRTTVAVVRIEPDEPGPPGTSHILSLAFTLPSPDQDRVIGTFLLQTLLFDPDSELR